MFVFVCSKTGHEFESDAFSIVHNNGVRTDSDGNRFLDAQVRLDGGCPFCGERHMYPANELSCPFGTTK